MNWIDTHTHTYDLSFGQDPDTVVQNALRAGVGALIQGGVNVASVEPIRNLCEKYPGVVYPTIGLHPEEIKEDYKEQLDALYAELCRRNGGDKYPGEGGLIFGTVPGSKDGAQRAPERDTGPEEKPISLRYVAVGEVGLDLYWKENAPLEIQQEVFRTQIQWAKEFNLPLVLHIRNAFEEGWHILKEEQDGTLRGVFHCYSGSLEQAPRVVDLGFYFGIGGVLTFKNAKQLPDIVKSVPPERLLLETDAPYLAPVPYRGQPNESAHIPVIGHKLADLLGITPEQAADLTTANARRLFHFGNKEG